LRIEFDWDAANVAHIALHGITPEECEEAYANGPMVNKIRFVTAHPMHAKQQEIYRGEE
jgi:hypothetical protein